MTSNDNAEPVDGATIVVAGTRIGTLTNATGQYSLRTRSGTDTLVVSRIGYAERRVAIAGRSVVDKAVAVVFPVMAFVAAGFEHSIANMYLMPLAMLLQHGGLTGHAAITWSGLLGNLLPVILGNVLGGAVGVAGVYHVIYRRKPCTPSA